MMYIHNTWFVSTSLIRGELQNYMFEENNIDSSRLFPTRFPHLSFSFPDDVFSSQKLLLRRLESMIFALKYNAKRNIFVYFISDLFLLYSLFRFSLVVFALSFFFLLTRCNASVAHRNSYCKRTNELLHRKSELSMYKRIKYSFSFRLFCKFDEVKRN